MSLVLTSNTHELQSQQYVEIDSPEPITKARELSSEESLPQEEGQSNRHEDAVEQGEERGEGANEGNGEGPEDGGIRVGEVEAGNGHQLQGN